MLPRFTYMLEKKMKIIVITNLPYANYAQQSAQGYSLGGKNKKIVFGVS